MARILPTALIPLLALLPALGGSCASPDVASSSDEGGSKDGPTTDLLSARFAVRMAEFELQTARLEASGEVNEAKVGGEMAHMKLLAAQREQAAFEVERSVRLDGAQLDLDRATGRATDAGLELAELEAMYADEEFAEKTKELVLTRGRRNAEHARRGLELQERKLAQLTQTELPEEEQGLKQALMRAKHERKAAQLEIEVVGLKTKVTIERAEEELREAREKLEKLEGDS